MSVLRKQKLWNMLDSYVSTAEFSAHFCALTSPEVPIPGAGLQVDDSGPVWPLTLSPTGHLPWPITGDTGICGYNNKDTLNKDRTGLPKYDHCKTETLDSGH